MSVFAACFNSGGASAFIPTNTPRAVAPPSGRLRLMSTPALLIGSIILLANCAISIVSPKTAISTVFPLSGAKASCIFCSWNGEIIRSAKRASICNRANRSCSAMRFASAARSLAWAISRRNPSAFAFASAECCSARARLSWALLARSFALAIARRNPSVFVATPCNAVSAAAALSCCLPKFVLASVKSLSNWRNCSPCRLLMISPVKNIPVANAAVTNNRTRVPISNTVFQDSTVIDKTLAHLFRMTLVYCGSCPYAGPWP